MHKINFQAFFLFMTKKLKQTNIKKNILLDTDGYQKNAKNSLFYFMTSTLAKVTGS